MGLVLEWVYGTIVSTAEKARDGAKRTLGALLGLRSSSLPCCGASSAVHRPAATACQRTVSAGAVAQFKSTPDNLSHQAAAGVLAVLPWKEEVDSSDTRLLLQGCTRPQCK